MRLRALPWCWALGIEFSYDCYWGCWLFGAVGGRGGAVPIIWSVSCECFGEGQGGCLICIAALHHGRLQHTILAFIALVKLGWHNNVRCLTQCGEDSTFVWIWSILGWLSFFWVLAPPIHCSATSGSSTIVSGLCFRCPGFYWREGLQPGVTGAESWVLSPTKSWNHFLSHPLFTHPPSTSGSKFMQVISMCSKVSYMCLCSVTYASKVAIFCTFCNPYNSSRCDTFFPTGF